jgi:hypothetical protein
VTWKARARTHTHTQYYTILVEMKHHMDHLFLGYVMYLHVHHGQNRKKRYADWIENDEHNGPYFAERQKWWTGLPDIWKSASEIDSESFQHFHSIHITCCQKPQTFWLTIKWLQSNIRQLRIELECKNKLSAVVCC